MRKRFSSSLAVAPPLLKAGDRVQAAAGMPAWTGRELAGPWGPGCFGTDEPWTSFWGSPVTVSYSRHNHVQWPSWCPTV